MWKQRDIIYLSLIIGFVWIGGLSGCSSGETELSAENKTKLPKKVDFNYHIKPILSDRCFACHGPDNEAREAGLRLDTETGIFATLEEGEGFAVVAKKPHESMVYHRITSDDPDEVMPPPESNLTLTEYEKKLIEKWIEQGAEYKRHWSFIAPEKPALPEVKNEEWVRNPIDNFVLAKLEENGLKPSPEADKAKLLRRVTFNLTGLPPTIEEMDAFLADDSPEAYEKVVDRLLASPQYGERMASSWLDIARYADSHGYQDDRPRTMWPWRDWVVKAFNDNLPFDEFATWQLAGDLLPNATYEQILATGFNRNHAITQEGGIIEEEYLTEYAADRVNTFSAAFLGLTVECARCHDHKYDPISQKEYFQLFDFFNNIPERGRIDYTNEAPHPTIRMQDTALEATIAYVQNRIEILEEKVAQQEKNVDPAFYTWMEEKLSEEEIKEGLEDGLLAYFNLDVLETEQFVSNEGNQFPARMNIGLAPKIPFPEHTTGKSGKALTFNGDNFLSAGDIGDFDHHHHFSYGAWVKRTQNLKKNAALLSRRNGEIWRQGYDLVLTPDNQLSASIIHHENKNEVEVVTKTRVPINTWTHVFVTYDGSGKAKGLQIYINGKAQPLTVKKDNLEHKSILNGNDFLVGNWHTKILRNDLYGFEGGIIDEVKLYERTLSPLEVQYLARQKADLHIAGQPAKSPVYRHFLLQYNTAYQALLKELDSLRKIDQEIPYVMVMQELDTPKVSHVLMRGSYASPGEKVEAGTPEAVLSFDENLPKNRLGLAQWLVSKENPLTARVAVNRLWQSHFGKGLVRTPEDFGNQGELPTHPELLDWLAVVFIDSGWDMKAMHKLIVMSATFRQSAKIPEKLRKIDSDNRYLARGPNVRLTAEMFRDNALAVSGLLSQKVGGKWVKPYQPAGIWKAMANQIGENKYRASEGEGLYRRSLYSYWKRTIPPPTMLMFDAPERTLCTVKRQSTSTPLQSLVLLNDPQYVEASRKLAERMLREGGNTVEERITFGFRAVTSRSPKPQELEVLLSLYEQEAERLQQSEEEALLLLKVGAAQYDTRYQTAEIATLAVVANTLLNLDEAKFRG